MNTHLNYQTAIKILEPNQIQYYEPSIRLNTSQNTINRAQLFNIQYATIIQPYNKTQLHKSWVFVTEFQYNYFPLPFNRLLKLGYRISARKIYKKSIQKRFCHADFSNECCNNRTLHAQSLIVHPVQLLSIGAIQN